MQPKPQTRENQIQPNPNPPKFANLKQIQTQKSKLLATNPKPISNPKTQAGKMAKMQLSNSIK
jgi:hypothetical protein